VFKGLISVSVFSNQTASISYFNMKTDQKRWSYPTSLSIFNKKIIQTDRSQKKVL